MTSDLVLRARDPRTHFFPATFSQGETPNAHPLDVLTILLGVMMVKAGV